MSAWSNLGLPMANAKGYGYERDPGFIRTPFYSALPGQKQIRNSWMKSFSVSWDLTLPELELAEKYLLEFGYSWFDLELVSSDTPSGNSWSMHTVRLTENYKVTPIASMFIKLSAKMESKVPLSICAPLQCDDFSGGDPSATCGLA